HVDGARTQRFLGIERVRRLRPEDGAGERGPQGDAEARYQNCSRQQQTAVSTLPRSYDLRCVSMVELLADRSHPPIWGCQRPQLGAAPLCEKKRRRATVIQAISGRTNTMSFTPVRAVAAL